MKKRFAVIFSVLMALFTVITTAFSLGVSAEGEKTVELTGAYYVSQKTGDIGTKKQNAPVFTIELRFSAPVTIPAAENIWLRISAERLPPIRSSMRIFTRTTTSLFLPNTLKTHTATDWWTQESHTERTAKR